MIKLYYTYDKVTLVVNQSGFSTTRFSAIPEYPRDALLVKPLPEKQGFAVIVCGFVDGRPTSTEYVENHLGMTIYDESDCTKSEVVSDLGPIKSGFTSDKPLTKFDERINGAWITNESNKYIHDYALNDATRETSYRQLTDALEIEYARKVRQGKTNEALILSNRIDELESKIKADNPWPTPPQA